MPSLPARIQTRRTEETLDTPENRFVKFSLTRWRETIAQIGAALAAQKGSAPVDRGLREVEAVLERLDGILAAELFREVGEMAHFPASSQVLQKKAGYRDLFQAYVQFDLAARLTWSGGERVYKAGQRNVATLYEYWVFLQLASIISKLCSVPFDPTQLLEESGDRLDLTLRQGVERVLTGSVLHLGRRLNLELWFNRTFSRGHGPFSSWTRPMRPDCSLRIFADQDTPAFEEVWVHFDAKYRVENIQAIISDEPVTGEEEEATLPAPRAGDLPADAATSTALSAAKRDDLLKMHAYRDAIRRSSGAYVIYPGSDPKDPYRAYHEILPGLGAFALVPTEQGEADGTDALRKFILDVMNHVASQVTQHERSRYWHEQAYADQFQVDAPVAAAVFLNRPPADTVVLTGYVRSRQQLDWIHREKLYNVRATGPFGAVELGSRELTAELLLLWGTDFPHLELWRIEGQPLLRTKADLRQTGYPNPSVEAYFCLRLVPVEGAKLPPGLTVPVVRQIRESEWKDRHPGESPGGQPVATTWFRLVTASARTRPTSSQVN